MYSDLLNITPDSIENPERDYFFLSKGHDVPALYGALAELNFMPKERLLQHLKISNSMYWHPNRSIPGVEFHSGSLGHLLAVAIGVAYDIKIQDGNNRVFVLLGDGELNEGSIWEACLSAAAHQLDNLIVVVDRNEFQANARTEELIPLEPIGAKFEAFGWTWKRIDGHDFKAMDAVFHCLPFQHGKPNVIIANTVRGKGLPSIEQRADRWFADFTKQEMEMLLQLLQSSVPTNFSSETLMVR